MKPRVLVVDDEQLVADTLRLIFEKRGFDCKATYSGNDAIACAEEFSPQLLLCDISMPGMDGLQVASMIAKSVPGCRVLLLTGHYTNLKSARQCVRALKVPNRVMVKPVQPEELLLQANALLQLAV